jgi:hypothetical protein
VLTREALIQLLTDHAQQHMYGSPEPRCECQEELADSYETTHAAHLVDVLEVAGYLDIREAEKRRRYAAISDADPDD